MVGFYAIMIFIEEFQKRNYSLKNLSQANRLKFAKEYRNKDNAI